MTYTIKTLIEAVNNSKTFKEVFQKLGDYKNRPFKRRVLSSIAKHKIDTSHLVLKEKQTSTNKIYSFEEILVEDGDYRGGAKEIKRRLFKAGMLKNECYICHITDWRGEPITLQLDHINGKPTDNRLENLRILCPNCHAQTPTYAGRNSRFKKASSICPKCGMKKYRQSETCLKCSRKLNQKINWPEDKELFSLVKSLGLSKTATKFGTTAPVLKKRLKVREFNYLPYKRNTNGK